MNLPDHPQEIDPLTYHAKIVSKGWHQMYLRLKEKEEMYLRVVKENVELKKQLKKIK